VLAAAGVKAVGRYLAEDGRGITAAEYQDLQAHGIRVWLVREGAASGMLGGFAQGVSDAQLAQAQIAAAGLPADSLVHAAADWDVQDSQFAACDDYMRGFASVLGVNRTGIYAGLHYMNHVHAAGLAVGFWQASATSWNHGEQAQMPVQYVQTTNTPPLPGTDHNYINDMTTVAGAATQGDDELSAADVKAITDFIDQRVAASEARNRRESRARVYQRRELPGAPLWSAGPTVGPRAVQADTPARHDKDILKGDTLLVDPGDFASPQPISEAAWAVLVEVHDAFRDAIADAVVAKLKTP
jgi:hypothetical protein